MNILYYYVPKLWWFEMMSESLNHSTFPPFLSTYLVSHNSYLPEAWNLPRRCRKIES